MPPKYQFGDFTLDQGRYRLHRGERLLRLEKLPMDLLILLIERRGELVSRDDIADNLWGKNVFLEVDHSINTAIRKIRLALREDPEKPRFVETVVGKGYRFAAPVIVSNGASDGAANAAVLVESSAQAPTVSSPVDLSPQPAIQPAMARAISVRGLMLLAGVAALVIFTATLVLYHGRGSKFTNQPTIKSLAVLPLQNLSGDASQEYLADGITEGLIGRLSGIHNLRVISRTSVMRLKDTHLSVPEIAKILQVDAIVEGSVIRDGSRIRVHAQLIRAATDEHFWSEAYDRELRDVLSLQSDVAQSIARRVEVTITGEEHARLSSARTVDSEAYEAYLKGRYYWNKRTADSMPKAALYFEQAISRDPGYGAAYSGLADCNSGLAWHGFMSPSEVLPKAYAAAQKAVEIDPQSAEAHASLALVLDHKWDWAGAEAEFKRALELNPQYANAHHWYGDYLSIQGRHDEALVEAKRALELDSLNLMIGTWGGLRYYLARRYDGAIEQSRNTVDLDPNFAAAHLILGESYVQQGKHKEGLDELQKAASLSGGSPLYTAQVGVSLALAGEKKEALRVIRELRDISTKRYVSPYGIAQIYAALNDKEQTYNWLESAYRGHAVWMSYLAVDPVFDSIRSEARFGDLLHRIGLD
jgi:TolB-like protein/DNA-binding winged helix-turn-helix (wHTH) protein/Flp pilus assembly protein TadD